MTARHTAGAEAGAQHQQLAPCPAAQRTSSLSLPRHLAQKMCSRSSSPSASNSSAGIDSSPSAGFGGYSGEGGVSKAQTLSLMVRLSSDASPGPATSPPFPPTHPFLPRGPCNLTPLHSSAQNALHSTPPASSQYLTHSRITSRHLAIYGAVQVGAGAGAGWAGQVGRPSAGEGAARTWTRRRFIQVTPPHTHSRTPAPLHA